MEKDIKGLLDETIETELLRLSELVDESEKTAAVDNVSKLYQLRIEESKVESDKSQAKTQILENVIRVGVPALVSVGTLVAYGVWYRMGLIFEENSTITAPMTRNLMTKMIPKL